MVASFPTLRQILLGTELRCCSQTYAGSNDGHTRLAQAREEPHDMQQCALARHAPHYKKFGCQK
eukprot:1363817-Amphidinium_carterae.1